MKLTVTGRKIEITDGIRDHLNDKMDKTLSSLGEEADVHVALSVEKNRHFAEITVKTKGFTVHSHEETHDLYASMDKALEKMEKQLRKHKEKAKDLRIKQGSNSKNQY
ncbi:MAG: ribosome-associated translation inhibitor RaiA [Nitrospinota bacterium]